MAFERPGPESGIVILGAPASAEEGARICRRERRAARLGSRARCGSWCSGTRVLGWGARGGTVLRGPVRRRAFARSAGADHFGSAPRDRATRRSAHAHGGSDRDGPASGARAEANTAERRRQYCTGRAEDLGRLGRVSARPEDLRQLVRLAAKLHGVGHECAIVRRRERRTGGGEVPDPEVANRCLALSRRLGTGDEDADAAHVGESI
jgi:hypothetical protein